MKGYIIQITYTDGKWANRTYLLNKSLKYVDADYAFDKEDVYVNRATCCNRCKKLEASHNSEEDFKILHNENYKTKYALFGHVKYEPVEVNYGESI